MSLNTEFAVPATPATAAAPAAAANEATRRVQRTTVTPAVDIFEDGEGITLLADLPGVARDQLDVKVEADHIWIEGQAALRAPEGAKALHARLREPLYRRGFTLSPELDKERIVANLKDGVLTLRIPRLPQAQPRRIDVQGA